MAEYKPLHGELIHEGHFPNTDAALLELHRLLAIFFASKSFAALRTHPEGEGDDPIYKIQQCEEDEITRLLLTLAITARVIDDREGRIYELVGGSCGKFQRDSSREESEELTLREACNKIIHANKVRLDVEHDDREQRYLNPHIYLYGELRGREWRAAIDVIAFAKEYAWYLTNL